LIPEEVEKGIRRYKEVENGKRREKEEEEGREGEKRQTVVLVNCGSLGSASVHTMLL
jgi:hypothetical protein